MKKKHPVYHGKGFPKITIRPILKPEQSSDVGGFTSGDIIACFLVLASLFSGSERRRVLQSDLQLFTAEDPVEINRLQPLIQRAHKHTAAKPRAPNGCLLTHSPSLTIKSQKNDMNPVRSAITFDLSNWTNKALRWIDLCTYIHIHVNILFLFRAIKCEAV